MIHFLKRPINRWFLLSMLPPFFPLPLIALAEKDVFTSTALIYIGAWILVWSVLLLSNWRRVRDLVLDEQNYQAEKVPDWARVSRRMRERNLIIFSIFGIPVGALAILWGLSGIAEFLMER